MRIERLFVFLFDKFTIESRNHPFFVVLFSQANGKEGDIPLYQFSSVYKHTHYLFGFKIDVYSCVIDSINHLIPLLT